VRYLNKDGLTVSRIGIYGLSSGDFGRARLFSLNEAALLRYHCPGNVRQLENVLQHRLQLFDSTAGREQGRRSGHDPRQPRILQAT
jgi:transcriptional regulator with AAA-type ATPase domain